MQCSLDLVWNCKLLDSSGEKRRPHQLDHWTCPEQETWTSTVVSWQGLLEEQDSKGHCCGSNPSCWSFQSKPLASPYSNFWGLGHSQDPTTDEDPSQQHLSLLSRDTHHYFICGEQPRCFQVADAWSHRQKALWLWTWHHSASWWLLVGLGLGFILAVCQGAWPVARVSDSSMIEDDERTLSKKCFEQVHRLLFRLLAHFFVNKNSVKLWDWECFIVRIQSGNWKIREAIGSWKDLAFFKHPMTCERPKPRFCLLVLAWTERQTIRPSSMRELFRKLVWFARQEKIEGDLRLTLYDSTQSESVKYLISDTKFMLKTGVWGFSMFFFSNWRGE